MPILQITGTQATGTASQTTQTCSVTNATTVGNFGILIFEGQNSGTTVSTVTDARGNTWTIDLQYADAVSHRLCIASTQYTTGLQAADLITVTRSVAAANGSVWVAEATGITRPFDVTNAGATATSTAPASVAATPTANGDLIVGVIAAAGTTTATMTTSGGWTIDSNTPLRDGTNGHSTWALDQVQSVAASEQVTGTLSASLQWASIGVAYKAAVVAALPDLIMAPAHR